MLQQPPPLIVDVAKQPAPTPDISVEVVITAFASAGVALLVAAVGGLLAGVIFILIRRFRDARTPPKDSEHVRLRI
jgi:hypothetical protein